MAAKSTVTQAKIYGKIGSEIASAAVPSGAATLTNFKALANMTNAGSALLEINGVEYAVPLVLNS